MRIDCIASTVEDSQQDLKICKDVDGQLSDTCAIRRHSDEIIIPSRLMNYVVVHCRRRVHTLCCRMRIKHEINIQLQKLDWWQKEKNVKKKIRQSSSPSMMQTKQKQLQILRNRGRWIIEFIEDLNRMQSTEFSCPRRRNEFWQTASTPSLRVSLCWKNAS